MRKLNKSIKRTIYEFHSLTEFYSELELEMILSDVETLSQIEKSYLEKKTNYSINNEEFQTIRFNRYTEYINSVYLDTVKKYSLVDYAVEGKNVQMNYTPISKTNALRYIKELYEKR